MKKSKIKDFCINYTKIAGYIYKNNKKYSIFMSITILVTIALSFSSQGVLANILNNLSYTQSFNNKDLLNNIILLSIFLILPNILDICTTYLSRINYININKDIDLLLLNKKSDLDIQIQDLPENKDIINRVQDGALQRIMNLVDRNSYLVGPVCSMIISSVILLRYSWEMFFLILIFIIPELIVNLKYGNLLYKIFFWNTKPRKMYWGMKSYFNTTSNLGEMLVFNNKGFFISRIEDYYKKANKDIKQAEKKAILYSIIAAIFSRGIIVASIVYLIYNITIGNSGIGNLTFMFYVITNFRSGLSNLFNAVGKSYEDVLYIKDFIYLMELKNVVVKPKKGIKIYKKDTVPTIEFKNVSFRYPGSDRYIFKNFSLNITAGEKLAIIGENGVGKTTFVKLLLRFYDPEEGKILIDDKDIKLLDISDYYKEISVLFQDFVKYNFFTVKEAIAIGDISKDIDMDKVIESAEKSKCNNFIKNYKNKYDQYLGRTIDDSEEPSGGEWQKLAIARIYYRNSNIWVLDEPTSSIDAKAEYEIFEDLKKIKNKTIIFISHRFSTVRKADKICLIDDGKVKEYGTHEELLKLNGKYSNLFSLQAKEYK